MSRPVRNRRLFHSDSTTVGNPRKKRGREAIGHKIKLLMEEGRPREQAIAIALNMAREGKLGGAAKKAAGRRKRVSR